ncbi:MAG TPA: ATP-binding protein [Acidimicrobiales bacterium]|jgi:anti-sigma regulatory factor (Ser/Thr protein kinase)
MPSNRIELTADVVSCSIARRFVQETLDRASDDLRNDASLLTAEVVTNALLHARGPITVEIHQRDGRYRIAVGDRSEAMPTEKGYRTDDATGRGVQLLNILAARWGCERTDFGKVVWFDLPEPFESSPATYTDSQYSDDPYPNGVAIALLESPVHEMIRTGAHYDALYREFRLILELDPRRREEIPGRLFRLISQLGTSFVGYGRSAEDSWKAAVRDERPAVDIHFRLPSEAGPVIERYNELLDEADDYCQRAEFLTIGPTDEALAVRRWAFTQVVGQCRGELPMPWRRSLH